MNPALLFFLIGFASALTGFLVGYWSWRLVERSSVERSDRQESLT